MAAAQMAILMRHHGKKTRPVYGQQQRQTDGEVIDSTAKQAVARKLGDAGVEVCVQQHAVNWPRTSDESVQINMAAPRKKQPITQQWPSAAKTATLRR